jgi:hypothetical protein
MSIAAPGAPRRTNDLRPLAVTMPAACRELGISVSLGYELAAAGTFPCRIIRAGRRIVVPRAELDRLLGIAEDQRNDSQTAA